MPFATAFDALHRRFLDVFGQVQTRAEMVAVTEQYCGAGFVAGTAYIDFDLTHKAITDCIAFLGAIQPYKGNVSTHFIGYLFGFIAAAHDVYPSINLKIVYG
jgi:hypothetical protein